MAYILVTRGPRGNPGVRYPARGVNCQGSRKGSLWFIRDLSPKLCSRPLGCGPTWWFTLSTAAIATMSSASSRPAWAVRAVAPDRATHRGRVACRRAWPSTRIAVLRPGRPAGSPSRAPLRRIAARRTIMTALALCQRLQIIPPRGISRRIYRVAQIERGGAISLPWRRNWLMPEAHLRGFRPASRQRLRSGKSTGASIGRTLVCPRCGRRGLQSWCPTRTRSMDLAL
jgi:hypothetical protein